jgi:hypothetical protein
VSGQTFRSRAEESLFQTQQWLRTERLTVETLPIDFRDAQTGKQLPDPAHMVMTLPTSRTETHKKRELESLTKQWRNTLSKTRPPATQAAEKSAGQAPSSAALDDLLDRNPHLFADLRRLPVNAVAFYRPFHLEPFEKWGIYIFIDPLMNYAQNVGFVAPFQPRISQQVLLHLVECEMFHHEFYHHLVESAATTIEILANALGAPGQSYLDYRLGVRAGLFDWHRHHPLEEALANAYAFHALSFISRVKTGYRDSLVGCYQRALHAHWRREGPGYRDAGDYLSGAQIQGNSELLAMVLGCDPKDAHPALVQVAQSVMPNGFAAFVPKPDIPTYLVGKPEEIAAFHALVPAPNETYCHLFWPFDTTRIDALLKARHAAREAAKRAARARPAG